MPEKIRDYRTSPEKTWMKEEYPGQFYELHKQFRSEIRQYEQSASLLSDEEAYERYPDTPEEKFYHQLKDMIAQVRETFLKMIITGYEKTVEQNQKEAAAHLAQLKTQETADA